VSFAFKFLLMSDSTLILPAFAKINLGLRVLGKRADGYHEIHTVLQSISLHDTLHLTITDSREIVLSCDDRSLPRGEDNLIYRAARALQHSLSSRKGARIRLEKRIPVQAGLGGGSSDAAVTLLGLAQLWEPNATLVDVMRIAGQLGSDVPFFFCGGTVRAVGTGSRLTVLDDAPERYLLIVKPNAGISTSAAYESLKAPPLTSALTTAGAKTILSSSGRGENSDSLDYKALRNDFEPVCFRLEPEIGRAKIALMRAGAEAVLLAGSGSALVGFFDNEDAQARAIQGIELEAGWRVLPCRTVGRDSYRRAIGEGARSVLLI
jgi:4-diphosphocytidyl-2-C-methyl-D-erythritol kinase